VSDDARRLEARYREARHDPELAVLEGFHALKHAIRFGARILDARTRGARDVARLAARLAPDVAETVARVALPVDGRLFDRLAPVPHPTGVIALARRPDADAERVLAAGGTAPAVFLDHPAHHGNIGAVVRVAAAAGAAGVLVSGNHDPWHPASLRGGAGLQFALPVARLERLPATDRPVIALDPAGTPLHPGAQDLPPGAVLVFGSERGGIGREILERATIRLALPMRAGVSSLNLATAVAVTLYCALARPVHR
jgi:RNA methyltransferase, TrmH family